uniref:Uncharacterized protein n=1 Tax=Salix viminalis TaxID=40686 RepID=A0A6N2LI42_SALVM
MLPMFVASGFRFVHSLPMKKSFLFTFLFDNRGGHQGSSFCSFLLFHALYLNLQCILCHSLLFA